MQKKSSKCIHISRVSKVNAGSIVSLAIGENQSKLLPSQLLLGNIFFLDYFLNEKSYEAICITILNTRALTKCVIGPLSID